MAVVFQDTSHPDAILDALTELADASVSRLRIAAAYTTRRGGETLASRLAPRILAWSTIPKTVVTTFDYGLTEPDGLEYLIGVHGFEVRIANLGPGSEVILHPAESFHPKLYLFDVGSRLWSLIGSPNLTERALRTNTEIAEKATPSGDPSTLDEAWRALIAASESVTTALIDDYRRARTRTMPPFDPDAPVAAPPSLSSAASLPTSVGDAVARGFVDLSMIRALWVDADLLSGGSHNQLELPQGAHLFFGLPSPRSTPGSVAAQPLGFPRLVLPGVGTFTDRTLTWHMNNQMERINLPTRARGGPNYEHTTILLRRMPGGYEIEVAPQGSTTAHIWQSASARRGQSFPLGAIGMRRWGVF